MAELCGSTEGAGVHPSPADRPLTGGVERRLQQERTEPTADEFGDQPEIAELGLLRRRRIELEIAGRHAARVQHENLGGRRPVASGQGGIANETEPVPPAARADGFVAISVERT